jgi:hypothetical protein
LKEAPLAVDRGGPKDSRGYAAGARCTLSEILALAVHVPDWDVSPGFVPDWPKANDGPQTVAACSATPTKNTQNSCRLECGRWIACRNGNRPPSFEVALQKGAGLSSSMPTWSRRRDCRTEGRGPHAVEAHLDVRHIQILRLASLEILCRSVKI